MAGYEMQAKYLSKWHSDLKHFNMQDCGWQNSARW